MVKVVTRNEEDVDDFITDTITGKVIPVKKNNGTTGSKTRTESRNEGCSRDDDALSGLDDASLCVDPVKAKKEHDDNRISNLVREVTDQIKKPDCNFKLTVEKRPDHFVLDLSNEKYMLSMDVYPSGFDDFVVTTCLADCTEISDDSMLIRIPDVFIPVLNSLNDRYEVRYINESQTIQDYVGSFDERKIIAFIPLLDAFKSVTEATSAVKRASYSEQVDHLIKIEDQFFKVVQKMKEKESLRYPQWFKTVLDESKKLQQKRKFKLSKKLRRNRVFKRSKAPQVKKERV